MIRTIERIDRAREQDVTGRATVVAMDCPSEADTVVVANDDFSAPLPCPHAEGGGRVDPENGSPFNRTGRPLRSSILRTRVVGSRSHQSESDQKGCDQPPHHSHSGIPSRAPAASTTRSESACARTSRLSLVPVFRDRGARIEPRSSGRAQAVRRITVRGGR